ncbi:DUF4465 domain-containing protein [uncultured Bacteroides sp.]|uniref:DUF4465 domain-containing protein n=1 Tax=uncultured Bacteroides sp. TaxID=162156 RepID=UPI002AA6D550|nr:DUF4465 domain-containing protein [uncultured Bacteroides sp.]
MKKLSLLVLLSTFVFCGCSNNDNDDMKTVTSILPTYSEATEYTGNESTAETSTDEWGTITYKNNIKDESRIFSFESYFSSWGLSGGSEFTNLTSGANSSITKKGVTNGTYITYYWDSYKNATISFITTNNEDYSIKGMYITNCYYTYNSMQNGDAYSRKFSDGDWLKVTIYNADKNKSVDFYLADYRDGKQIMVDAWQWVDLTSLGVTDGLQFEMSSSDSGNYGMNTPSYFCMDGITLIQK